MLIKGDTDATYSAVMAAMDELRKAGIEDIGLITDPKVDPNAPAADGRQVAMAHAHKHFGAEKVVTGETPHASSDMNVTPLIDVLLVLLIIFMAALPLTQKGVDINLPLETNKPAQQADRPSRSCSKYNADRTIADQQAAGDAGRRCRTGCATCSRPARRRRCSSSATRSLRYGEIIAVIDAAKGAGVEKVGIVTEGMRRGE